MAFGEQLIKVLHSGEMLSSIDQKNSPKAFWVILRNTAIEDIKNIYPHKIDSNIATAVYYKILSENMDYLPDFICEIVPSNKQERFRVVNRNLFSSNAFHRDGLANQPHINAEKVLNLARRGYRITFQWESEEKL